MPTIIEVTKARLAELGVAPKKALGQNFLINRSVIQKVTEAVRASGAKLVIEVGPGLGSLTDAVLELAMPTQLIELDSVFCEYWRSRKAQVIQADALHLDWSQEFDLPNSILMSNLPYQISSSIVIDRSVDAQPLSSMILMFQKEVAQRIRADQGTELYGFLSVIAQSFWKIQTLIDAGQSDFYPPPKVNSRVLLFEAQASPVRDKKQYLRFIKGCFSQPRKLLVSNLERTLNIGREKSYVYLEQQGLSPKVRAEELKLKQFIDFYKFLGYP